MLQYYSLFALAVLLNTIPQLPISQMLSQSVAQTTHFGSDSPNSYYLRSILKQSDETTAPVLLRPGIYRNGYRQIQIAQNGSHICIQESFNYDEAIDQIRQEADSVESQLQTRLRQEFVEQRHQIEQLLQSEELINSAIQDGQLSQEQAELIQDFRERPQLLDQFLEQRAAEFQRRIQTEIYQRRIEAEKRIRKKADKIFSAAALLDSNSLNPNFYVVRGTDFVLLPQIEGRVLFGESDNLQEYVADNTSLHSTHSISPNLQECLNRV